MAKAKKPTWAIEGDYFVLNGSKTSLGHFKRPEELTEDETKKMTGTLERANLSADQVGFYCPISNVVATKTGPLFPEIEKALPLYHERQAQKEADRKAAAHAKFVAATERAKANGRIIVKILESRDDGWGEGTNVYKVQAEDGRVFWSDLWHSCDDGVYSVEAKTAEAGVAAYAEVQAKYDAADAKKSAEKMARDATKSEAAKVEEARIAAVFATAKATGEKKVLITGTCDCHDPKETECSFDNFTVWAMPDGTTTKTYTHCY